MHFRVTKFRLAGRTLTGSGLEPAIVAAAFRSRDPSALMLNENPSRL
jgi:hypothetical protein